MGEDERAGKRDFDLVVRARVGHVGHAEQDERRAFLAVEMAFHRGDLGRLMFERVEPVHVAGKDLHGRDERRHPHGHREHGAHAGGTIAAEEMQGADSADGERRREIGG